MQFTIKKHYDNNVLLSKDEQKYLFKSDSLSIDIESLFCFEHSELAFEVVVIKRPALLSTKEEIY